MCALAEILRVLESSGRSLAASVEPGALEARHIRLFTARWWQGYPPRAASELAVMLGRLREKCLRPDADYRTPWESNAPPETVIAYERAQVNRSLEHLRASGWL
jgi:hypothetical protein